MSRRDDEGRPVDLAPLHRGGTGVPTAIAAVVLVGLIIALAKPWSWGAPPPTPIPIQTPALVPTPAPTPDVTSDVLAPIVTPAPSGEGLIVCLRFDAWRLLTISRSRGKLIRTWTAITPILATGPNGVREFARVSDGAVLDVGYCGPVMLLPGNPASVTVTAWRKPDPTATAVLLGPLHPAFTSGSASRALFRRPVALREEPSDAWPSGLYVFHVVAGRPDPLDVWFGVEIAPVTTGHR